MVASINLGTEEYRVYEAMMSVAAQTRINLNRIEFNAAV
jgi:hypothetical protein